MRLYLTAKTSIPDLFIDYIQVKLKSGEEVSLNWDYSDIERTSSGFSARYKGVYFDEAVSYTHLIQHFVVCSCLNLRPTTKILRKISEKSTKLDGIIPISTIMNGDKPVSYTHLDIYGK